MEILIRPAREQDYEALCALMGEVDKLHRDNLPYRFQTAEGPARSRSFLVRRMRASDIGLFVAETGGSLVGFIDVEIRQTPDIPIFVPRRYAIIDDIAVKSAYRRAGIGEALMTKARVWAEAKGATSIELNVYAFNRGAIAFYRQLGYEILSHRMVKRLESDRQNQP